jgi:MurNAc alpha-1-phosphate uridylyltransferase
MKAMILAAGVGERMRPLTNDRPKPLLEVGGKALIAYHLEALAGAGIRSVVINVSYLGQQVMDALGDGQKWGLEIGYSQEDQPLETAGGIVKALPMLGEDPFLVVNCDVFSDYPLLQLMRNRLAGGCLAHLVMVPNPAHHPGGDFWLDGRGFLRHNPDTDVAALTYAGIGLYTKAFFAGTTAAKLPLRPLLDAAITNEQLGGELHTGEWSDIGTPERLREIDARERA